MLLNHKFEKLQKLYVGIIFINMKANNKITLSGMRMVPECQNIKLKSLVLSN